MQQPDTIMRTSLWFHLAFPNPPENQLQVQMGCHFEEVAEMVEELSPITVEGGELKAAALHALEALANNLKGDRPGLILHEADRKPFLDALCDQIVTATGSGYLAGCNVPGALSEVNRSNFSKFDEKGNPVFKPNGKIDKGPNYTEPDLAPYVLPMTKAA